MHYVALLIPSIIVKTISNVFGIKNTHLHRLGTILYAITLIGDN